MRTPIVPMTAKEEAAVSPLLIFKEAKKPASANREANNRYIFCQSFILLSTLLDRSLDILTMF